MRRRLVGSICAATLLFAASAASADVTVDDVWTTIRQRPGVDVSAGSVARTAGGITISNLTMTRQEAGTFGHSTATLEELTLTTLDGGRVAAMPSGAVLVKVTAKGHAGETLETEGRITAAGARIVISGTPEKMLADVNLPDLGAEFLTTAPGKTAPVIKATLAAKGVTLVQTATENEPDRITATLAIASATGKVDDTRDNAPVNGEVTLTELALSGFLTLPPFAEGAAFPGASSDLHLQVGDLGIAFAVPQTGKEGPGTGLKYEMQAIKADGAFTAKPVAVAGDIPAVTATGDFATGPYRYEMKGEDAARGNLSGSGEGFAGSLDVNVPALAHGAQLGEALAKGLTFTSRLDAAPGTGKADFNEGDIDGGMTITSGKASLEVNLSQAGMLFGLSQQSTTVAVTSAKLGEGYGGAVGETTMRLGMPVSETTTPQPFAFAMRMIDLTLSEAVWALFDPDKQIARTPASLIVEASGTAVVTGDMFADRKPNEDLPMTPETLDLTRLKLSFGGAEIGGSGALAFVPKGTGSAATVVPTGKLKVTWKGVYGLMGKLGNVPWIPREAMFGLRGVIGMVSKAVGPDDLVSEFEFKADGSILANGTLLPMP